ncbi:anti-sigma factor antagonist [Streptomyces sp. NPDC127051]|uniref:anti-sigma factor antagonist n=1 Tax=Streptomyces sp. NPDC127051 TaxID=3347119 RepID=UPI003664A37C
MQGVVDGIEQSLVGLSVATDSLLLAVREGLVNAIRHGCAGDPDLQVSVGLTAATGGEVTVRIQDPGPGFVPGACPDPTGPEERWRSHGRGLFLMRHLADQVQYAFPSDGGSVLTLTFKPASSAWRSNEGDPMPMPITTRTSNGVTIIDVSGNLDAVTAPMFQGVADEAVAGRATNLVVNLAQTRLLDSSGAGALMSVCKRVRSVQGDMYLSGATAGQVSGVLKLLGMDKTFKNFGTADEAVQAFQGAGSSATR